MAFQDSATAMVNMWFSRYRVRAMSIREATGNLGSTILIPLMTLVIAVWDPVDTSIQPRGKQVNQPEGIWYTSVTGIWQTVWLEQVPESSIASF